MSYHSLEIILFLLIVPFRHVIASGSSENGETPLPPLYSLRDPGWAHYCLKDTKEAKYWKRRKGAELPTLLGIKNFDLQHW